MSNKSSKKLESVRENARINNLVEKLRSKLKNFVVMDRQGELIGEVKDLILDTNRQLNLVVSKMATNQSSRLFLLISKLIQKIDPPNKSVFVDINKAEIDNYPEYVATETPGMEISDESPEIQDKPDEAQALELTENQSVLTEEIIRLLGERLVVDRSKRKVGEVIVRKEIETRMVQVPVRREKLIVEQVSPERKQLAEIDLGQEEVTGIELAETVSPNTEIASLDTEPTVRGEFNSPKIASLLLNAIALERRHGCKQVRVEIVVENEERQKTYQEWIDRCSSKQPITALKNPVDAPANTE